MRNPLRKRWGVLVHEKGGRTRPDDGAVFWTRWGAQGWVDALNFRLTWVQKSPYLDRFEVRKLP